MQQLKKVFLLSVMPVLLLAFGNTASAQEDQGKCAVTIDRSVASGVFDVTRQEFEDGTCICYAYTGPLPQSEIIENRITILRQRRTCPEARLMTINGGSSPGNSAVGFMGLLLPGLTAAAATRTNNPVSP